MSFYSILYNTPNNKENPNAKMPGYFSDLYLDQILQEILTDKEEYHLESFYYECLHDAAAIKYRQYVMKELENASLLNCMCTFSRSMKKVRDYTGYSRDTHHLQQQQKWHLDAVCRYCSAVLDLNDFLNSCTLEADGLISLRQWLNEYTASNTFNSLHSASFTLLQEFSSIKYSMRIERNNLVVSKDENESDYSHELIKTFEKINESVFDYKISFFTELEMCGLETRILDILQKDNKEAFRRLEQYCLEYKEFLDPVIVRLDRELQFYISYQEFTGRLKRKGFQFAYPHITKTKSFNITNGYDLALASKLLCSNTPVIANDLYLGSGERIAILTGPNQGGKTTYARAFGQILHLSSIGCPIPCQKADIFLFDGIFTHFSEEEQPGSQAGRLKEELVRLRQVLEAASPDSVIIINELFASTTSHDAYTMGAKILGHFISHDCFCLYVTHIHELSLISEKVASFTATIDTGRKEARTYRIVRKPADGKAYANTIAEKYRLDYSSIKERIAQ